MAIPAVVNLINRQSQLAIDIEGASTDNRARAIQWTGNRQSANQQSEIKPARNPAGAYSLFAKHSGKALIATPEGAVEQTEFDPMHAFMRFRLVQYNRGDYAGAGAYWILAEYSNGVLSADSTTAGAPLVLAPQKPSTPAQL